MKIRVAFAVAGHRKPDGSSWSRFHWAMASSHKSADTLKVQLVIDNLGEAPTAIHFFDVEVPDEVVPDECKESANA